MRASDLIEQFEKFAPPFLAESGDPVGIQIGDANQEIHRVLVTLDVRPEVVQEAIQSGADMIFAHHPAVFRKIQNLDYRDPQKRMYGEISAHQIVVYAAHTNLDSADGGMNDWLAAALKLTDTELLVPGFQQNYVELTISGSIGQAISPALMASYQATLIPSSSDQLVQLKVPETNVYEFTNQLKAVLPATVGFTSQQLPAATHQYGMGRVGNLQHPTTVRDFAKFCKTAFSVSGLRLISQHPDQLVHRVAVLGGDGGKFYHQALAAGADVYVTGDVYYHTAHDMLAAGLTVIDPGHHIESICKPHLTALFQDWAQANNWNVRIQASQLNTDPFTFI